MIHLVLQKRYTGRRKRKRKHFGLTQPTEIPQSCWFQALQPVVGIWKIHESVQHPIERIKNLVSAFHHIVGMTKSPGTTQAHVGRNTRHTRYDGRRSDCQWFRSQKAVGIGIDMSMTRMVVPACGDRGLT